MKCSMCAIGLENASTGIPRDGLSSGKREHMNCHLWKKKGQKED